MMPSWAELQKRANEWVVTTFGYLPPRVQYAKLAKEAAEAAQAAPCSRAMLEELADCRICLMTAEEASGFTDAEIRQAVVDKLTRLERLDRSRWVRETDGTMQSRKEG